MSAAQGAASGGAGCILVGIKRVIDYSVRVRVRADGSGVIGDGVKMSINPFDEIALEEALRVRERGVASQVIVASVGPPEAQQQLRTALAMGADRAVLLQTSTPTEPLQVARALLALARRYRPMLVLLGKQAIDDDNSQTGPMLAALWERPQATFASKLELEAGRARVTREVDEGLETLEIELPAVITTDLRLNQPRYVRLPEIMKAKHKPLELLELSQLEGAVDAGPDGADAGVRILRCEPPPPRARGVMLKSAAELLEALRSRGLL